MIWFQWVMVLSCFNFLTRNGDLFFFSLHLVEAPKFNQKISGDLSAKHKFKKLIFPFRFIFGSLSCRQWRQAVVIQAIQVCVQDILPVSYCVQLKFVLFIRNFDMKYNNSLAFFVHFTIYMDKINCYEHIVKAYEKNTLLHKFIILLE